MRFKNILCMLALLCAVVQGAWAQASWDEVYAITQTNSANWTQLTEGSTTGKTLGTAGSTTYYYADTNLTFSNSTVSGSGLTILGTVYFYVPDGVTVTCTGADASGTTGGGAGIELTEGNTLYLLGSGTVNATGGNAANGGNGGNGNNAECTYDESILGGSGGNGGNGGGGAGAGIGTRGGNGGNGGTGGQRNGSYGQETTQYGVDGNAGSGGSTASAMGTVCTTSDITVNAQGGAAGSNGTGGNRGLTASQHPGSNVYMASGGGGGGAGGFGGAANNIGTGGPGGGGGGGGAAGNVAWVVYSGTSNGYYHAGAKGGNGGKNADGSSAPNGADVELTNPKYADIQAGGLRPNASDYDDDDGWEKGNGCHEGGSGGAAGSFVTNNIVTSTTTTLTSGLYYVISNVTVTERIQVSGNVTLNLSEGVTLTPKKGIEVSNGNSLTINGPGALTIDGCDSHKSGIGANAYGKITINGGTINVTGGSGGAGIGGDYHNESGQAITINGGVVNVQGGSFAAGIGAGAGRGNTSEPEQWGTCNHIYIYGGQVTAIGGGDGTGDISGAGIGAGSSFNQPRTGTLTLGWTNPDDFIYSSGYVSEPGSPFPRRLANIYFVESKQFIIEGTATIATTDNIGGKKIVPYIEGQATLSGAGTQADPWRITSTADWNALAQNVLNGNSYSGQYVRLEADIEIAKGVGAYNDNAENARPFSGTFLGNNKTITAAFSSITQGAAPFRYISGATIKNLTVAGTITSNQRHMSGLVGFADSEGEGKNLIEGCIVTATINTSTDYTGGFVGHGLKSATTIRGCIFAGTINGVDGSRANVGIFWGWSNSGTPALEDCLEKGTYINISSMHPIGLQAGSGTINNCYYVTPQIGSPTNACTVNGYYQAYTTASVDGEMLRPLQLKDGNTYYTPCVINVADIYKMEGSSISVTPVVTASDGTSLTLGTDFTATLNDDPVTSFPLSVTVLGTNTFTVTGLGNCHGSKSTHFIVSGFYGEGTADSPYLINSVEEWTAFVTEVNSGNNCSGKVLKLTADIAVTQKCGTVSDSTPEHAFSGTFLGDGHTITVTLTDNDNQGAAPFCYINGATFKDLTVAGTVNSNKNHSSGFVGFAEGTNLIEGCTVRTSVTINCDYAGGFVGKGLSSATTIRNCVFAGIFNGISYFVGYAAGNIPLYNSPHYIGSFWGWSDHATPMLENCIEMGSYNNVAYTHPMGLQGGDGSVTNFYYLTDPTTNPTNAWTVDGEYGRIVTSPSATEIQKQITVNGTTVYSAGCSDNICKLYGTDESISIKVTERLSGIALTFGSDYTATLDGEPVEALPFSFDTTGSHTLVINGNGNYSGSKEYTFSVIVSSIAGDGTEENPYRICNTDDWNTFATFVNGGNDYSGKFVKLMADIAVTQKVGVVSGKTPEKAFSGTFDGNGHTIWCTISDYGNQGTAPFCYINGATIKNLIVAGSITSGSDYMSGLVGFADGINLIEGCNVSAYLTMRQMINASGFIGHGMSSATTIKGCVFSGQVTGFSYGPVGVFWGWSISGTPTIENCLEIGSAYYGAYMHPMGLQGGTGTITNCYFVTPQIGSPQNACTVSGAKRVYAISSGENVSVANADRVTDEYSAIGLIFHEKGFEYGGKVYASSGDEIHLTLSNQPGFTTSDYTASGGTLSGSENPYTLTMPDANVTINAQCTPDDFAADASGNYIIASADDWIAFCAQVSSGHNNFLGKTVKLNSDISVSTMAGSSEANSFQGTFLGERHTITAAITDNSNGGAAPFRYIKNATIKNLTVAGTITSNQRHIAGLVGFASGTNLIEGCTVTATLNINTDYAGGIIGHGSSSATTICGCVFAGTMNSFSNPNVGVIWGWSDSGTPTLENSLEAGTYTGISKLHPMGLQSNKGSITNCYYVTPQIGSPENACTVSGARLAYTFATAHAYLGELVKEYSVLKVYQNGIFYGGTYYAIPAPLAGSGTEGEPYIINNDYDWNAFAYHVNNGISYSGEYVKLEEDISVSTMVGTSETNSFQGTFLGGGYTLTFTQGSSSAAFGEENCAPFRYVKNATFKNLKVAGDIYTSRKFAAGLAARTFGTTNIIGCQVGTLIYSRVSGDGTHGGIVAMPAGSTTTNITGCVYNGRLLTNSGTYSCGGFVGWHNGATISVSNSLYAPGSSIPTGWTPITNGSTFVRSGNPTIEGCYYTETMGDAQGTKCFPVTVEPTALGNLVQDYGVLKAYQSGVFYDGTCYMVPTTITLANNSDNSTTISDKDGYMADVTLDGRTFYRDGAWNTLCLPFNATKTGPLAKTVIKELDTETAYDGHKTGFEDGTLYLNFKDAESIVAGKPYIVKWSTVDYYLINPSDEVIAALDFITEVPTFDGGQETNWEPTQNQGPNKMVDGNTATKYGLGNANPWVEFHYTKAITPKGYALMTAEDTKTYGSRNPKSWTIKAKNSGDADWTTLTTVDNTNKDKLPMANNQWTVFALDNSTAYQYFRFEATKNDEFQLAELRFCNVQPGSTEIVNPTFGTVALQADAPTAVTSEDGKVSFAGYYSPVSIAGENRSVLYLGADNTLYYPNAAMTIGAFRAHFTLNGDSEVKAFNINFGDDETTGIISVHDSGFMVNGSDAWYTLDGRKLDGKPSRAGVYINNGKKVVIK